MPDQTPEARLAAALAAVEEILAEYGLRTYDRDGIHRWRCEYPDRYGPCECFADMMQAIRDAFLAADPTLAADLALAAAVKSVSDKYFVVRRLPSLGTNYPSAWQVWREDGDGVDYPTHTAPTLTEAIEEALTDD